MPKDPAAEKERLRQYYLANRERVKARSRAWQLANPERRREISRDSRKRNYQGSSEENRQRILEWQRQNPDKVADRQRRRRKREQDNFVEVVDRATVYERDHGICYLCLQQVDKNDFHVDHVIPLVLGGEHSYANVRVTHPRCNYLKGKKAGALS